MPLLDRIRHPRDHLARAWLFGQINVGFEAFGVLLASVDADDAAGVSDRPNPFQVCASSSQHLKTRCPARVFPSRRPTFLFVYEVTQRG